MTTNDTDPFAQVDASVKEAIAHPEVGQPTAVARFLEIIEREYGPLLPHLITGATIRAHCRFCRGRGCLDCDTRAHAEYQRQFPHGPEPLYTLDVTTSTGRAHLQQLLDPDVVRALAGNANHEGARRIIEEAERVAMWDALQRHEEFLNILAQQQRVP